VTKLLARCLFPVLAAAAFVPGVLYASLSGQNDSGGPGAIEPLPDPSRAKWRLEYLRPATIPFPADNLYSKDREILGWTLFFDPRLSGSKSTSCASCHNPGFSWGDGLSKGVGAGMKQLERRTPTILNAAWSDLLFWDGRAEDLEQQALDPITGAGEMNQPLDAMIQTVDGIDGYRALFARAYPGEPVNEKTVARAIATFERTIVSGDAPFDRWISGDEDAISSEAKRGFDLFNGKAACARCHSGWNFTDNGFHDIGIEGSDRGRGVRLPLAAMQFAFKTPTLRNADRRAPFMHDGSEPTLEDVVEFYDRGGKAKRPSLAPEIVPLNLSPQEKKELVELMRTLTSVDKPTEVPLLPR
jgi:cytochrome c peroxidase